MTLLYIFVCLRCHIYLQSTTWVMGRIMSQPKTSWPGILPLVVWYVERTAKADAPRITIHGSASYIYVSCRLYVRTILPSTWCILSTIVFACRLPGDEGLLLIPYSFSIKLFLNSWPRNSPHWSYVISNCHDYWTSRVVSTKFAIVVNFLSRYCVSSNYPVTGSIIVTDFKIKGYLPFLHIW